MATTLSAKGQVTIPKEIRKILRVSRGDKVDFIVDNKKEVKLKVVNKGRAKAMLGSLNKYAVTGFSDSKIRDNTKRKVAFDTAKEGTSH